MPPASAVVPGTTDAEAIAITADHCNMVKFASPRDGGYEKVSGHLQIWAGDATDVIDARWAEQERIRNGKKSILV